MIASYGQTIPKTKVPMLLPLPPTNRTLAAEKQCEPKVSRIRPAEKGMSEVLSDAEPVSTNPFLSMPVQPAGDANSESGKSIVNKDFKRMAVGQLRRILDANDVSSLSFFFVRDRP